MPSPGGPHRAVCDALNECPHKEVLDLVSAKPAIAPRMVTGSVELKHEEETEHSGNTPCRGGAKNAELIEASPDQLERSGEQSGMIPLVNPTARPRWVRQRDSYRFAPRKSDFVLAADELLEGKSRQEALDGKSAHWEQKSRSYEAKLVFEPARAVLALSR